MRFAWLQLDADFVETKAGELAVYLGVSRHEAVGLMVDVWAWCLKRTQPGAMPTGEVPGERAGALLAHAAGWSGTHPALVEALLATGFLEALPNGLRVRGLDRYHRMAEKNNRRKAGAQPEDDDAGSVPVGRRSDGESGAGETPPRKKKEEERKKKEHPPKPPEGEEGEGEGSWSGKVLVRLWNDWANRTPTLLPDTRFPQVLKLAGERLKLADARAREWTEAQVAQALEVTARSDWHRGQNDRKWVADFEWFIRPTTIAKALEKAQSGALSKPTPVPERPMTAKELEDEFWPVEEPPPGYVPDPARLASMFAALRKRTNIPPASPGDTDAA